MHLGASTKVIADMLFSDKKFISIRTVHIQQQTGGSDCGLFSIASAMALCNEKDPGTLLFQGTISSNQIGPLEQLLGGTSFAMTGQPLNNGQHCWTQSVRYSEVSLLMKISHKSTFTVITQVNIINDMFVSVAILIELLMLQTI